MIPSSWAPYYRKDDGELLGYLVPDGELVTPVTVFGYELGDAADEYNASQVLEGIAVAAESLRVVPGVSTTSSFSSGTERRTTIWTTGTTR